MNTQPWRTVTSVSAGTIDKWLAVTTNHQKRFVPHYFILIFFIIAMALYKGNLHCKTPIFNEQKTKLCTLSAVSTAPVVSRVACSVDEVYNNNHQ